MGYAAKLGGSSKKSYANLTYSCSQGVSGGAITMISDRTIYLPIVPDFYKYLNTSISAGGCQTYVDGAYVGGSMTNYNISGSKGTYRIYSNSGANVWGLTTYFTFHN